MGCILEGGVRFFFTSRSGCWSKRLWDGVPAWLAHDNIQTLYLWLSYSGCILSKIWWDWNTLSWAKFVRFCRFFQAVRAGAQKVGNLQISRKNTPCWCHQHVLVWSNKKNNREPKFVFNTIRPGKNRINLGWDMVKNVQNPMTFVKKKEGVK